MSGKLIHIDLSSERCKSCRCRQNIMFSFIARFMIHKRLYSLRIEYSTEIHMTFLHKGFWIFNDTIISFYAVSVHSHDNIPLEEWTSLHWIMYMFWFTYNFCIPFHLRIEWWKNGISFVRIYAFQDVITMKIKPILHLCLAFLLNLIVYHNFLGSCPRFLREKDYL